MIALGTGIILGKPAIDKLTPVDVGTIIASYPVKIVDKLCYVKSDAQAPPIPMCPLVCIELLPLPAEICSWPPHVKQAPRDASSSASPSPHGVPSNESAFVDIQFGVALGACRKSHKIASSVGLSNNFLQSILKQTCSRHLCQPQFDWPHAGTKLSEPTAVGLQKTAPVFCRILFPVSVTHRAALYANLYTALPPAALSSSPCPADGRV